ncbi:hypothetical protein D6D54_04340 [Spiroplasma poulsonii]|uniref:Transmembrane protein n=1 Tax=Spiroplasma poulsonii TaxID=2138 RepID=A0A3S0UBK9_9MOLU|nr:hypothetical protein [Spiroplasma poulsonii]RUP77187.1 hypothetical protein D6D54_04340 [Spiroplasma poulsonii]
MMLGNSEIAFILIGFFVAINIIVLIFLIVSYRNILVPIPNLNNTPSQTMTSLEVIDRYLTKKKISGLKVVRKPHQVLITNSYKKKTFYINDLQLFNQSYFLSGIGLDYILGRTFFATQLHLKNRHIRTMNFLLYVAPPLLLFLFFILSILIIIFYVLIKVDPSLLDFNFFYFIEHYGILNLILIFIIAAYLILLGFNGHFKQNLENLYETEMRPFVKKEFPELYDDWIIARSYARGIKFTYLFGYNFIFKQIYKYTGPFGL